MAKKFVVFVDTQVDFMVEGAALYVAGAQELIGPLSKFAYSLNPDETAGVLFTYDTHYADSYPTMPESKQFPIHCVSGTPGWYNVINSDLIDHRIDTYELRKGVFDMWESPDNVIHSDAWGGFFDQPRDVFFEEQMENGVNTVAIVGVALNFCVKQAILGFITSGFQVELHGALTVGIDTGNGPADTDPTQVFASQIAAGTVRVI
jgi:nicotinamidase/pyrazinamidase